MSGEVTLVWDDALSAYDLGPGHPLRPERVQLTVALARACGLLDVVVTAEPLLAGDADLLRVHTAGYVEAVKAGSEAGRPLPAYGLGAGDTPAFPGMHLASALVCGATIEAAAAVLEHRVAHAFSPAGGLHHAMPGSASGFCIYNDPAVAIAWLLAHGVPRVAYVDVDVHHGDGVERIFREDPRVLTVSLHESGRFLFPGTGFPDEIGAGAAPGTVANLALPPGTTDELYLAAFDAVVPPLVSAFAPTVLITQLGCDTHATDPLAHLALTVAAYRGLARRLHGLAHETAAGRWVATGGGGYQWATVVPRAWAGYLAEMAGRRLPLELPAGYRRTVLDQFGVELDEAMDDPQVELSPAAQTRVAAGVRDAVRATQAALFPLHGLTPAPPDLG